MTSCQYPTPEEQAAIESARAREQMFGLRVGDQRRHQGSETNTKQTHDNQTANQNRHVQLPQTRWRDHDILTLNWQ